MAKIANYKRIITTDYDKEHQPIVEELGRSINDGFNQLYFNMNGRIDLRNNIFCTVKEVDIVVNAEGIPLSRTIFALNSTQTVIGCTVLRALNQVNSNTYPTTAPFISFSQIDQAILINHITGLQANQRYTITIVAFN